MVRAAIVVLALWAAPAIAADAPYKLIVVANDSAVAVDYPSRDRCMKAAAAAEGEASRRMREASAASTDPILRPALRVIAFCIPG